MIISAPIFEAYLKCPSKCWQFCLGEKGEENVYLEFIRTQDNAYRTAGLERLMAKFQGSEHVALPSAPVDIKTASWRLAIGIVAKKESLESHLHAVERLPSHGQDKPVQFIPIRFI